MVGVELTIIVLGALTILGLLTVEAFSAGLPASVSLSKAIVVTAGAAADPIERQAAAMLRLEIKKRTGLDLPQATTLPADDTPVIIVGSLERMPAIPPGAGVPDPVMKNGKPAAEGYVLAVDTKARQAPAVCAIGNDRRGTLFAVGALLRSLDWTDGSITVPAELEVATAPAYPIRGTQLGYRRCSDTYDAWDISQYAQYVRDLIVFGNNSIELIPALAPGVNGPAEGDPLMPLTPWDMTVALTALLDAYDMDVWMWIPLESGAAQDSQRRASSLREREGLFAACKRIDHVFVPGGDPGDTPARILMPYLKDLAAVLRKHHPKAGLWVSPQGFERENRAHFYEYLQKNQPDWLTGIVYGPGVDGHLREVRKLVPAKYPIRHYPDITHGIRCQYQIPDWDAPWNETYERQPILPRPTQMRHVCNLLSPYTAGAVAYSDGTGDDVNKMVWNAMLWNPKADLRTVLCDFGRYFVGPDLAEGVADGLLMLEQNWSGLALANTQVPKAFTHWQAMEKRATPKAMGSWRFQQGLIRAYGDAYVQARLKKEAALLQQAYDELAKAPRVGSEASMAAAEQVLNQAYPPEATAPALRERIEKLAEMLFHSIGMQLSTTEYGGSSPDRGALLDSIDNPVTDGAWLLLQFPKIRQMESEQEKLAAIDRLVHWEDPGPGSFYDDLGYHVAGKDPHLVRGSTWEEDPGRTMGVVDVYEGPRFPEEGRLSWVSQTEADGLEDSPLVMRYTGLDPKGSYMLRAVYGTPSNPMQQIYFDGKPFGEPLLSDARSPRTYEFEVPRSATADGELEVAWRRTSGRWVAVSEVWLIKRK
jgi:hypothetical protein